MKKPAVGDIVWTIAKPDEANDPWGQTEPWRVKVVGLFPEGTATLSAFRDDGTIDDDTNCTVTRAEGNRWFPSWRLAMMMHVRMLIQDRAAIDLEIIKATITLATKGDDPTPKTPTGVEVTSITRT